MVTPDEALLRCPWHGTYSVASFSSEVAARLLDPTEEAMPFGSRRLQQMFRGCSGFTVPHPGLPVSIDADSRLIAALLHKLAYRGIAAPCSVSVEDAVVSSAVRAGLIRKVPQIPSGSVGEPGVSTLTSPASTQIEYHYEPSFEGVTDMLVACLIPELLVETADLNDLVERYSELCEPSERGLFDAIVRLAPDPRLALLFYPQRLMSTMIRGMDEPGYEGDERVDFAVEIPPLSGTRWLRLVVEIDGSQHNTSSQRHNDRDREHRLDRGQDKWPVQRIRLADVIDWDTVAKQVVARLIEHDGLQEAVSAAARLRSLPPQQRDAIVRMIRLPVAEAQLLSVVANTLNLSGRFTKVTIADPENLGLGSVVHAVNQWMSTFEDLHSIGKQGRIELADEDSADIVYYGVPTAMAWKRHFRDDLKVIGHCFAPLNHVSPLLPAEPRPVIYGDSEYTSPGLDENLRFLLRNIFRKHEFRQGQLDIIRRALSLNHVIGLLPTGAGKSLCYQLVAFTQPGMILVIDPLRSLMIDQREALRSFGITRCFEIRSDMSKQGNGLQYRKRLHQAVSNGWPLFVLVSPERLQIPEFREGVEQMVQGLSIPYCVVDEAHCVSEWGHEFRPAYLNIGSLVASYCKRFGSPPPTILGLTATASTNVLVDVKRELGIEGDLDECVVQPGSFDRPNLQFKVMNVPDSERTSRLIQVVEELVASPDEVSGSPTGQQTSAMPSGLVFSYYVNGANGVADLERKLRPLIPSGMEIFSGSAPKNYTGSSADWERTKERRQTDFKKDRLQVMICTHSFGMGIDKPNVRFTVHAMLPRSVEEFYQQAGRAGRDGQPADCIILFSDEEPELAKQLLSFGEPEAGGQTVSVEEIRVAVESLPRNRRGDALRNTWFLTNNFLGEEAELLILEYVVSKVLLPHIAHEPDTVVTLPVAFLAVPQDFLARVLGRHPSANDREEVLEKALYRLSLIGVVNGYMKDYSSKEFLVEIEHPTPGSIHSSLKAYLGRYSNERDVQLSRYWPTEAVSEELELTVASMDACKAMIGFVYGVIEKRRRRAMWTMLDYARRAIIEGQESFRALLLAFLGETRFKYLVANFDRSNPAAGLISVLRSVGSEQDVSVDDDVRDLVGACDQHLEEYPDDTAVRILSGIGRLLGLDPTSGLLDMEVGLTGLFRDLQVAQRSEVVAQLIDEMNRLSPAVILPVLTQICSIEESVEVRRVAARSCYAVSGNNLELRHDALKWLAWSATQQIRKSMESVA